MWWRSKIIGVLLCAAFAESDLDAFVILGQVVDDLVLLSRNQEWSQYGLHRLSFHGFGEAFVHAELLQLTDGQCLLRKEEVGCGAMRDGGAVEHHQLRLSGLQVNAVCAYERTPAGGWRVLAPSCGGGAVWRARYGARCAIRGVARARAHGP